MEENCKGKYQKVRNYMVVDLVLNNRKRREYIEYDDLKKMIYFLNLKKGG